MLSFMLELYQSLDFFGHSSFVVCIIYSLMRWYLIIYSLIPLHELLFLWTFYSIFNQLFQKLFDLQLPIAKKIQIPKLIYQRKSNLSRISDNNSVRRNFPLDKNRRFGKTQLYWWMMCFVWKKIKFKKKISLKKSVKIRQRRN